MVLSNMTDLDVEDSLTKLNTQLNKSMVLMDTTLEAKSPQPKHSKTIKINTKILPATSNVSPISRKSILKKTEKKSILETQSVAEYDAAVPNGKSNRRISMDVSSVTRPYNINDLVQKESLIADTSDSTFNLDDLSDSEDIWIMDVPRTIDPKELKGQTIMFGEKSKFKVNEERYYAVSHEIKCNVTCVLNTDKANPRYRTVNVKPTGTITIRRKLSSISNSKPMHIESSNVPFPKNLKTRHPLFGVSYEGKVKKVR